MKGASAEIEAGMQAPASLFTQRLRLRRPTPGDVAAAFEYASDPEVTRYMDWRRLTERPNDLAIGALSCRVRVSDVDYGFVPHRRCCGRGLVTEAATAVAGWLFSIQSVQRVWATCDVENARSARVLEKSGLRREGRVPGGVGHRTAPRIVLSAGGGPNGISNCPDRIRPSLLTA